MKIKDIVAFVPKSITPKAGKIYRLYSLPSFMMDGYMKL